MAKNKLYFQCDLKQGTGRDTAYIEERGAVVGKMVELNPGSGDYWEVISVADKGVPWEQVKKLQDGHHKGWASLTDI